MRGIRSIVRDQAGDGMVEFVLTMMVLMSVIFGAMDVARAAYLYHFVSYAAQQGGRYAMVRGAGWGSTTCSTTATVACNATNSNVQSYVRSLATTGITSGNISVATSWPGKNMSGTTTGCTTTNTAGCLVKVTVTYSYNFLTGFLPKTTFTLTGTSEVPIQK